MDSVLYAGIRQRELLAEAERARLGRLAVLAQRCRDACRPGLVQRITAAVARRMPRPVTG